MIQYNLNFFPYNILLFVAINQNFKFLQIVLFLCLWNVISVVVVACACAFTAVQPLKKSNKWLFTYSTLDTQVRQKSALLTFLWIHNCFVFNNSNKYNSIFQSSHNISVMVEKVVSFQERWLVNVNSRKLRVKMFLIATYTNLRFAYA